MGKRLIAFILICTMLASAGCAAASSDQNDLPADPGHTEIAEPEQPDAPEEAGPPDAQEEIEVKDLDKTAMEHPYDKAAYFLDVTYKNGDAQNTIVSPLSLDMALGLVSGGAKGATGEELAAYLSKEDYGAFASAYMQYAEQLNLDYRDEYVGGYRTVFEIANSVWVNDSRTLVADYADKAKKEYQAEIASVGFDEKRGAETAKKINEWCDRKTHGLIPSIITEQAIKESMAMILVNSLYFEAPWTETWYVAPDRFTDLDGNETTQDMLKDTLSVYFENDKATAFSKPYRNGLEFIGILPKQTGDFEVGDLDLRSLLESRNMDANLDVHASMPKLNFETTSDQIVSILRSQGVETPFDEAAADFSGLVEMRPDENTYISDILQKCKIELDENGTKAAAVTAISLETMAMLVEKEEKEVYLDRPFAFLIYDRENDQIVFIGKVVSPES